MRVRFAAAAAALSATALVALTAVSAVAAQSNPWQLIGKDSDRNSEWASADVFGAEASYPSFVKVVGLATRKAELEWRIRCYNGDFSSSRSGSRRMLVPNKKITVYPPVMANAEYCFISAGVDTGWSLSGKRATASVWVLAG